MVAEVFTGIVEEVGSIVSIRRGSRSATLRIQGKEIFSDMKLGDSIAVNGICLTVTEFGGNVFSTDATPETLDRTSLSLLSAGFGALTAVAMYCSVGIISLQDLCAASAIKCSLTVTCAKS